MVLTIFCLLLCLLLGYIACKFFLPADIAKFDLFLVSLVIGLVIMCYSVLLFAFISHSLQIAVYVFVAFGAVISVIFLIPHIRRFKKPNFSFSQLWPFLKKINWFEVLFVVLMILLFLDLYSRTLYFTNGSYFAAVEGAGDIPFHMNQVSYFIYNQPFGLENPIYSGTNFAYHFMINLLSASLFVLNKNYVFSFQLPAILFGLASILLLYSIISKIIKQRVARAFSFLIFFLGTGIGFFKILADKSILLQGGPGHLFNYLMHLPYSIGLIFVTSYPEQNILWSTFLTMCFMHQRAFLIGMAVSLTCIVILYFISQKNKPRSFYFVGIIIGLLPLIQVYSFVAMVVVIGSFALAALIMRKKLLFYSFLKSALLSAVIFFPSFLFLFSVKKENGIKFRLGWMMNAWSGVNFNPYRNNHLLDWLDFIWQNAGFLLPVLVIAIIYLVFVRKVQKDIFVFALVLGSVMLWCVLNTIKFQSWDFDNYKIYGYFLLVAALVVGVFFDQLKLWLKEIPVFLVMICLILSRIIMVLQRTRFVPAPVFELFNKNDISIARWITENTSSGQIILTAPTSGNPVSSLAGRPVVLGDFGWIWPHGLNWNDRYNDMEKIYHGDGEINSLLKKYKIGFVLIGDRERADFKANEVFFSTNYPLVFQLNSTKIYKIIQD